MPDEIVDAFSRLPTAAVADVFRQMGYPQQVMEPTILPLDDNWRLCGRAFTHASLPARKGDVSLFDDTQALWAPGNVIVEGYWGAWGLNFSIAAKMRGCVGAVVDGSYRDIPAHRELLNDFPVFCRRGLSERSSNPGGSHRSFPTRWLYAYNVPVNCCGVRVEPNDIILGDADGVVVIPRDIEEVVLKLAISYEEADDAVARALRQGKGYDEAREAVTRWPRESGLLDLLAQTAGTGRNK